MNAPLFPQPTPPLTQYLPEAHLEAMAVHLRAALAMREIYSPANEIAYLKRAVRSGLLATLGGDRLTSARELDIPGQLRECLRRDLLQDFGLRDLSIEDFGQALETASVRGVDDPSFMRKGPFHGWGIPDASVEPVDLLRAREAAWRLLGAVADAHLMNQGTHFDALPQIWNHDDGTAFEALLLDFDEDPDFVMAREPDMGGPF